MPCTVENCASWPMNSLLDSGFSGSWCFSCSVINRMKSAWPRFSGFLLVGVPVVAVLMAANGSPLMVAMGMLGQEREAAQRPIVSVARASSLAVFRTSTPAW